MPCVCAADAAAAAVFDVAAGRGDISGPVIFISCRRFCNRCASEREYTSTTCRAQESISIERRPICGHEFRDARRARDGINTNGVGRPQNARIFRYGRRRVSRRHAAWIRCRRNNSVAGAATVRTKRLLWAVGPSTSVACTSEADDFVCARARACAASVTNVTSRSLFQRRKAHDR